MSFLRCALFSVLLLVTIYFGFSALYHHFDPHTSQAAETAEDNLWIATSKSWFDRHACRWVSLCGLAHWHPDPANIPWRRRRLIGGAVRYMREINEDDKKSQFQEDKNANCFSKKILPPNQVKEILTPDTGNSDPRVLKEVPQYVIKHAPLIHLYSGEHFWPSDIIEHLIHTKPYLNYSTFKLSKYQYTPYNLHELNHGYNGNDIFLHSKDDVESRPNWLGSTCNKPAPYNNYNLDLNYYKNNYNGKSGDSNLEELLTEETEIGDHVLNKTEHKNQAHTSDSLPDMTRKIDLRRSQMHVPLPTLSSSSQTYPGGYSCAPSFLIIVDKGSGIVDAFWFYFYSYNLGATVFNIRFGNHVGDWEHSLIRFENGIPQAVFVSAHSGGLAYHWDAVEKSKLKGMEERPLLYSAVGSHAMYATPGRHSYILPFGLLADVTDKGPLWDPALNYLAYNFNTSITHNVDARENLNVAFPSNFSQLTASSESDDKYESFQPAANNPLAPLGWWWYAGRWGDKFYELRDWRQWRFIGQYHYVNGPFGPRFKNLGRANVCQSGSDCRIIKKLSEGRSWIGKFFYS